jgi:glucosyl-3-phosphoglycerate synthase
LIEARVTSPRGGWFHHDEFSVAHLIAAKRNQRVAVCIPARNEEATVGAVVGSAAILQRASVVDEVIVVDDASEDGTARVAQGAGARVVRRRRQGGKGAALRRAVASSPDADIFVFLDADVVNVSPRFVVGLLGPLLLWPEFVLVKAAYRRSLHGRRGEGGRVTELMARPLLDRWFPELADVGQPLAGECAIRRCVTDTVGFDGGYAIEIGLLIDVAAAFGREAIAEVDLDDRLHRNRSLSALRWQAAEILDAVLRRVDLGGGGVEDDR